MMRLLRDQSVIKMSTCANCKTVGTTRAHVKDKAECLKDGVIDHEYLNIVDLCYNCHYLFFDERKMGIKKVSNKHYFVYIDDSGIIMENESSHVLNINPEYILWKNKKCVIRLWPKLFNKK